MRARAGFGQGVGLSLVAALLLAACGDGAGAPEEEPAEQPEAQEAEVEPVAEVEEPEEAPEADAGDAAADDGGEPDAVEEDLDPFEPGTILEATYIVEVLQDGLPCPLVELEDGRRLGLMSSGFPMDATGQPAEPGFLIDLDGTILFVQPEDWVDFGVPEGETVAADGDRVRLESGGAVPVQEMMMRAACGYEEADLLVFRDIEALS